MSSDIEFTKQNLDEYLKALAKEYRRLSGTKIRAELILIGGASVLINYNFRPMTSDVDGTIQASSAMKDAINRVGDKYGLPFGWLNEDFVYTKSYTRKLSQFSTYYRTFSNIVEVRTISAEYLVAMKLCAGRQFKHDFSDVVGILAEHKKRGIPISMDRLKQAYIDLYEDWNNMPGNSQTFINYVFEHDNCEELYDMISHDESIIGALLEKFETENPGVVKEGNLMDVVSNLTAQADSASILQILGKKQKEQINITEEADDR